MGKKIIKAIAIVSVLVGGGLQAGIQFYNTSGRTIRVEGAAGLFWTIENRSSKYFETGLRDTLIIKGINKEADQRYGVYKYLVKQTIKNTMDTAGRKGEKVRLKKATYNGHSLEIQGVIGDNPYETTFTVIPIPIQPRPEFWQQKYI